MAETAVDTDVIVVGAGPTGLMLAGELRLGGARVVVLERLAEPTGQSRGLGFTARAMEVFDQRGLLPRFGRGDTLDVSPMGHFGGVQFDYTALEDGHFGARGIPQNETEAVLEDWARELGADVRRGWEVTELAGGFLDGERVEVAADTPEGPRRLRAAYLVGCDGGQSRVRRLAGFDFPGVPATRAMYLADVVGCGLKPRFLGERLPNGMVMAAPLKEGVDRIIVCPHGTPARERDDDVGYAEVAAAWQRITGEDISGGSAEWVSSFSDAARLVTEYRRGRVLLAGDAAHIHLPAGGQGLSTGVQDAANLGWKLAAEVTGRAPAGLLDTYHGERHPVGERLMTNTRAQGMVFLGGEQSDPLRAVFAELIGYDVVKRHLAGIVSHLDIGYDVNGTGGDGGSGGAAGAPGARRPGSADGTVAGAEDAANGADTAGRRPAAAAHPLLGRRLAKRPLTGAAGETDTFRLLHPGRGVLIDLADSAALRAAAAGWSDEVDTVTATAKPVEGSTDVFAGLGAALVRPDGHVAWTSDGSPHGLAGALHRWFGGGRAA